MIYPIVAYGDPVLKKVAKDIDLQNEALPKLLENMWQTMYNSNGIGLAAPQIGKSIRVFLVDTEQLEEADPDEYPGGIKAAFINAKIEAYNDTEDTREEGCLSIPGINGDVDRPTEITITYFDESLKQQTKTFSGFNARVIQHEYDHIEGKLFTEKLSPLKRRLLKGKLDKISKGKVDVKYRMRFPQK
ncbi:MAG: peptide deformylase [Saprospiraceae bacterium]|nr:peptide deformylase [Saprospiraceae bacterium]